MIAIHWRVPASGAPWRHTSRPSICAHGRIERTQIDAWLPLVAAARLVENVPDEFDRLTELAQGATLG